MTKNIQLLVCYWSSVCTKLAKKLIHKFGVPPHTGTTSLEVRASLMILYIIYGAIPVT